MECVFVSILVLMDSSFQSFNEKAANPYMKSFNPCFNGFFFSIIKIGIKGKEVECFNPCFNGFFFSMIAKIAKGLKKKCFNPCFNGFFFSITLLMTYLICTKKFQSLF